jgi:ferredoxin
VNLTVRVEGCEGHGNCYTLCPEVFAPDEDGYATVTDEHPAVDKLAEVEHAVANCPEGAISVEVTEEVPASLAPSSLSAHRHHPNSVP